MERTPAELENNLGNRTRNKNDVYLHQLNVRKCHLLEWEIILFNKFF